MNATQPESNAESRLAYILGVPLAEDVVRQWPQMGEIVRTNCRIAEVEGNFPELTLEVGRRLHLGDVVVVEWTANYGDGRLYRNVTIGELQDGTAVRVTGRARGDSAVAPTHHRQARHARRWHLAGRTTSRPSLGARSLRPRDPR